MGAVVEFGMGMSVSEDEATVIELPAGKRGVEWQVGEGREKGFVWSVRSGLGGRSVESPGALWRRGRLMGSFTRTCVLVQDDKLFRCISSERSVAIYAIPKQRADKPLLLRSGQVSAQRNQFPLRVPMATLVPRNEEADSSLRSE